MFELLKKDFSRYSALPYSKLNLLKMFLRNDGFRAICFYRFGVSCKNKKIKYLPTVSEKLMHHLCHCWISLNAEIGPGFFIAHVGGISIGEGTRIGENCDVRRNISFGGNYGKVTEDGRSHPWVGDNVSFGVGAVIAGPVTIGSNSIIGANTVVTRNVPEGVIVSGVPGVIIKKVWDKETGRGLVPYKKT